MKNYLLLLLIFSITHPISSAVFAEKHNNNYNLKISENDIVINEIMFDPSPRVNLPEAEYVEIFNTSDSDIQLENWKLQIGKKSYTLSSFLLESKSYLLLTKNDELFPNINTLKVKISSLSNSGTTIKLISDKGELVNQFYYNANLFSEKGKKNGGWSLELINPYKICLGSENWTGSKNSNGGTPGLENSVLDSNYSPEIKNYISKITTDDDVSMVNVFYKRYIDDSSLEIETNYLGEYNFTTTNEANGSAIISVLLENAIGNNTSYFLLKYLLDCNQREVEIDTIWISKFENIDKGDILINEVMFNPKEGSNDFIELFNNTNKYLSLRNIYVSNFSMNDDVSEYENEKILSDENIVFPPKTYFVITKNAKSIKDFYTSSPYLKFIEISTLPRMNNEEGNVAVLDASFNFIDKMVYSSEMHLGLISSEKQKGLSLERIKISNPSLDFNNWTSASQESGGATPGLKNSVSPSDFKTESIFEIYPEVFTPNNDGTNDVVELKYNLEKTGLVANVKVFNSNGIFIKEIANNSLLGTNGSFIWNGMNSNNVLCQKGIYIFWIEIFDTDGNVTVYKEICVLG